jgi:uncharacterized membrane protein
MPLATLVIPGWHWAWIAAALCLTAAAILLWSYRASPIDPVRWLCLTLKALGIAALAFCLLEPLWSGPRVRPGANLFALVADNSQGLTVHDPGHAHSRGEELRTLLDSANPGWQPTLESTFDVRRHLFDTRLQPVRTFAELSFDGRASAIGEALRDLAQRYRGRPLAGILLFTDGNATDIRGSLPDFKGLPPVYPVVLGERHPPRDLALQPVTVSQTAFEDAPVTAQAELIATGFADEDVVAQLLQADGREVQRQVLIPRRDPETLPVRFQWRPDRPGTSFYQIRVRARSELDADPGRPTAATREATLANNRAVLAVDRGEGPYRILYVAGRPNWEFKFLNRALESDDQLQLVALIRVARREPKFDFRGRAGESSNPLFRGFDDQSPEAVERYDQPVLIRLNTRDKLELRSGFPRTPEDLYAYDALILDDLEAAFFSPDQSLLVQHFVAERGGGFLMLGGLDSFQSGSYHRTPIGDLLPVYLDRVDEAKPAGPVRLQLTREGWLQSWVRLHEHEADERARLDAQPPFLTLNRLHEVKPGASTLATVRDAANNEFPALVAQRFGRGRAAALTVGDLWRWGLKDATLHADLDKAWRQIARWLVADVPRRVELAAETLPADPHGAVQLQVRVRDPKFQPVDDATVTLDVRPVLFDPTAGPLTNTVRLPAEPSLKEPGLYETTFVPRLAAGFLATASVTNDAGIGIGRAETGWASDTAADEFRSLAPNIPLLEAIARQTGGELVHATALDAFVRRLPTRAAPVMETRSSPLWHTPAMFAFALVCLLIEWGLRRRQGLP